MVPSKEPHAGSPLVVYVIVIAVLVGDTVNVVIVNVLTNYDKS